MNKAIIIVTVILAIVLSACVPVATMYVCSDGSSVSDPSLCKAAAPQTPATVISNTEEPAKVVEPPVKDAVVKDKTLTKAAQALFDKAAKTNNVKFNYFTSTDPNVQDKYVVSKFRLKVELVNKMEFSPKELYDTVYLDFRNQEAQAYCERQSIETCPDKDKKYPVNYNDYKVKTPFQWLDFVEKADVTTRSKQVEGKTAKEISFEAEGKNGTMWLDSYFGVPLEVEYMGVTYKFQNMYINDAADADLVHPIMNK